MRHEAVLVLHKGRIGLFWRHGFKSVDSLAPEWTFSFSLNGTVMSFEVLADFLESCSVLFRWWLFMFSHSRSSNISISSTFLPSRSKVCRRHRGHAPKKRVPRDISGHQSCKCSLFKRESKHMSLGHLLGWCLSTLFCWPQGRCTSLYGTGLLGFACIQQTLLDSKN